MKNRFWQWFAPESKRVYRATLTVHHRDGTPITVAIESTNAEHVSSFANLLRRRYAPKPGEAAPPVDKWAKFSEEINALAKEIEKK